MQSLTHNHQTLRAAQLRSLLCSLERIAKQERVIVIGTVCSGTDMPLYILGKLAKYWCDRFGITIRLTRDWLKENFLRNVLEQQTKKSG